MRGENLDVWTFGDHRDRTVAESLSQNRGYMHARVHTHARTHTHTHTHTTHHSPKGPFPPISSMSTSALAQSSHLYKAAPYM